MLLRISTNQLLHALSLFDCLPLLADVPLLVLRGLGCLPPPSLAVRRFHLRLLDLRGLLLYHVLHSLLGLLQSLLKLSDIVLNTPCIIHRRKEGNVLFNDALNTFYLRLYGREREMFYLMMHSSHFIYGYMASDKLLRTSLIVTKDTCCRHIGYSFRLAARVLLYAPSNRQDSTYHGLCYTNRGALVGTRNSSMSSPHEGLI